MSRESRDRATGLAAVALCAVTALFVVLIFARLGHPLFWHDEAETAAFAQRVLRFGYPKVHDGHNTLYSLWSGFRREGIGIDERTDAYTGSPWLQYYVGALGVAAGAGSHDLYARTAWVRGPFAVIGCAGLAWLFAALWPSLGASRSRRLGLAAVYGLAVCGSALVWLHLREARHYSLTLLGAAAFCFAMLRRHAQARLGYGAYAALTCGSLLWLFHSFHPAALALGASGAGWLAWRARAHDGPLRERAGWLTREAAPFAAAALLTAPLLGFFDFFAQTQGWARRYGEPSRWLDNAGFVAWTLLRHDWLLPALLLRLAVEALARRGDGQGDAAFGARLAAARFLSLAILVYALLMTGIPFLFERYFVALGPLLCAVAILDLASVLDAARAAAAAPRRIARAALALAATVFAGGFLLHTPELAGRVAEIRRPVRGPLDYVIPYLAERYPDPSSLVVATNYEEPAFMFYLGSRVLVGFYAPDLERDLKEIPDVIVPRPWPDHMEELRWLSTRASYAPHSFPVGNLRWNNTPSLSARVGSSTGHRFRDPVIGKDGPELVILERVRDSTAESEPGSAPGTH
ncbi:MAG TPA: hypothetical protein VMS55_17970 [Myxococcota bacterium]|nr:hypothetical protein [Myxococcota bacterium]